MPLLAPEPNVFPATLLQSPQSPVQSVEVEDDRRWWVLHSRPRAEKGLARTAFEHSIPFFLPTYMRRWQNAGRTFTSHLPLFPGYFFLRGDEQEREVLLETRFVAHCLAVIDQDRLHADLARLYDLTTRGVALTPEDRFVPGTRITITSGPMRGMEGKVLRVGKKLRLVVEVEFLKRGVSVEIEQWMAAALPEDSKELKILTPV